MATKKTALGSQYTQAVKEYQDEQSGISMWEQALTGLQEAYKPQIEQINKAAEYDISQAFANYKKSQRALLQDRRMGSGLKEHYASGLASAYENQAQQIGVSQAQSLYETQSAFGKDVAALESQFAEYGEKLAALDKAIYESEGLDINLARLSVEEGGLGHYEARDGKYVLTNKGKTFYDKALNDRITRSADELSFQDWLLHNEYDDIYEFYTSDADRIRGLLAGEEVRDAEYTTDEGYRESAADSKKAYEQVVGHVSDKTFDTYQAEDEYYKAQLAKEDVLTSVRLLNRGGAAISEPLLNKTLAPALEKRLGISDMKIDVSGKGDNQTYTIEREIGGKGKHTEAEARKLSGMGFDVIFSDARELKISWKGSQKDLLELIDKIYDTQASFDEDYTRLRYKNTPKQRW